MNIAEILILSTGLAMDTFAVSIAAGFALKQPRIAQVFKIAFVFGMFQAGMPFFGWLLASSFSPWVEKIDHWIAFSLLLFIGSKMIFESFEGDQDGLKSDLLKTGALLMLAVATSIDALAAGISISFLNVTILSPVIAIGLVTFVFSFVGVKIGSKFGHYLEHKVTVLGGLVLIGLGIKILIEHLSA